MTLICNDRNGIIKTLDRLIQDKFFVSEAKFLPIQGRFQSTQLSLKNSTLWQEKFNYFQDVTQQYDLIND